ncbi:MAG TPA: hypothetical protein VE869_01070, partial [Gemmatimonas sp.]|nr:hypothetical protein [Gemmatimonas sp.]
MMHLLRVRVAVVVGISGLMLASTTLAAQPTGLDRFVGEWSGPLVTPSLRGTVTHRLSRSADALVIQTTVSARGTTLHGSAERIQLRADTLTFHVDLGGSNIEWTAILRENGLVGTVRVRQQMDVVADGVWEATRPASNIPAVVGAAALLDA